MVETDSLSRFELVTRELRALGLTLRRLPGEYCVNFRNGGDATARMAEDLGEALELGRAMAAEAAARATEKPPRRRWRRKRMTPKARRRRFILGHNRRLRARALRKLRGKP
jgi:hypothetical protein